MPQNIAMTDTKKAVDEILQHYANSFKNKEFETLTANPDILMNSFGITSEMVEENKQYWNRELGKCWERVIVKTFEISCPKDFKPALRIGADEPVDFIYKNIAIDTKYRVGSGDSGTLKKFKQYGEKISNLGYEPYFLFLRTDNLPAAITAIQNGGWNILMGEETFSFIKDKTGYDLKNHLLKKNRL